MHLEGGVGAWLAQTHGESSPPAFMRLMETAERTRANLEEMMLHSLQPGANVWDEMLACPASLKEKPTDPVLHTLMHQLQDAYLTGRRKGRFIFCQENTQGVHHTHLPLC